MKISGYTTARNVIEMDYPFEEAIRSVLAFADEVIVLDSTEPEHSDGTSEYLNEMSKEDPRIRHIRHNFDWSAPNHGIFDGQAKALARSHCTGDYLWQFDVDEIVHEVHTEMVRPFIRKLDWKKFDLVALPVIDFWGHDKMRIDVSLCKWRLSVNKPEITHGIPIALRTYENALLYARNGTDGCDYVDRHTGQVIPCAMYMPAPVEQLRLAAVRDARAVPAIESWVNKSLTDRPAVFHYSWFNINRKIQNYKQFWDMSWKSLYNEDTDERANPMFPGKRWSEITDEMITEYAKDLEEKTCGHVFHRPWDGSTANGIKISLSHPAIVQKWINKQ